MQLLSFKDVMTTERQGVQSLVKEDFTRGPRISFSTCTPCDIKADDLCNVNLRAAVEHDILEWYPNVPMEMHY